MFRSPATAPDGFRLDRRRGGDIANNPLVGEPMHLDGYTEVYAGPQAGTGVLFIYGQSNMANFSEHPTTRTPTVPCHMLDSYTGKMFVLDEPLVGCNGGLADIVNVSVIGNTTFDLCIELARAPAWRSRIVVCNVTAGGTSSAQWAGRDPDFQDDCSQRLRVGMRRLLSKGLTPNLVIRHQGETDATRIREQVASSPPFSAAEVTSNILRERDILREEGYVGRILVCIASRESAVVNHTIPGINGDGARATRAGQLAAIASDPATFLQGPDTDQLGSEYRYPPPPADLHWNTNGKETFAAMLAPVVRTST